MSLFYSVLIQTLNPGKGDFGRPYDSLNGISAKGKLIFYLIILAFGFYIGIKVWLNLRKEK